MKKILAILLSLVVLLSFSTVTAIAAESDTQTYYGMFDPNFQGETLVDTDVEYHAYSTYSVTVPTNLVYGEDAEISVDMSNVEYGYCVVGHITNVDKNGYIDMVTPDGDTAQIALYFNNEQYTYLDDGFFKVFSEGDLNDSCTVGYDFVGRIPEKSGVYSGVICFKFMCLGTTLLNETEQ